jgi:dihydroxyacetone kinase-like protein
MKEKLTSAEVVSLIRLIRQDLLALADGLSQLDAAVGDGDLGVTITLGMNAVEEGLKELEGKDIGTVLMKSGMNFNRAASSTFGTILSTALMRAGKSVSGKGEIGPADMAGMLQAAETGIMERGKASLGDKTVLDALIPLRKAFDEALAASEPLDAALAKACRAAEQGVEKTKAMVSGIGRGKWLGDRSMGHPDPGATVALRILESLIRHLTELP